jgi:hypothetical protein
MKKILLLLLFITGTLYAQPPIAQPNDLIVCDDMSNDGFAYFDLTLNESQTLNGLNPSLYDVRYFNTLSDAQNNAAAILNEFSYYNSTNPQTIYIRVQENANPTNYATTSFNLIVNPLPAVLQPNDIIVYENPFDGSATFDLTQNEADMANGATGLSFQYYLTLADAQAGTNAIPNQSTFTNTSNPQTIFVSVVDNTTGCFSITNFDLVVIDSSNGIIYIPDANFKAKLISADINNQYAQNLNGDYFKIDANNNGEIEFSEALQTRSLNIQYSSIMSIVGIEYFTNLESIDFRNNLITNVNLNTLVSLNTLVLNNNELTNLDVSNLTNLIFLHCEGNELSSFNVSGLSVLENLNISFNQLNNIVLNNLGNLKKVNFSGNQLTNLNLSNFPLLTEIRCEYNDLTSLNVDNLVNLKFLFCAYNELTNIDISDLVQLQALQCGNNLLANLDLIGPTFLITLGCQNNLLTTLDYSNMNHLKNISFGNSGFNSTNFNTLNFPDNITDISYFGGQQIVFDFSIFTDLTSLFINNSNIESIDVSQNINLNSFSIWNNLNLKNVNVKNGQINTFQVINCPDLEYVCIDTNEAQNVINALNSANLNSVSVNTYCSFAPGGNYNSVTGIIQYDFNNNGCDALDSPAPYVALNLGLNAVSLNNSVFTNFNGNYIYNTNQIETYDLTPNLENPNYFSISPNPASVNIPVIDNSTTTQNFCITANGAHPDLEIVIAPITPARPGFDAVYKIVYRNKGNQTVDGYVNFTFNDAVLDFVSSSVTPNNNSGGFMNWFFPGLVPFQTGSILVTLNVNSPTETPAVNIGDILAFNAFIDVTTDDNWADNNFDFNQTVVGSYDPNDITCIEGDVVSPSYIGEYLHYVINFENTGTYQAENIVVKTEINPADFDISTLRLLEASHNVSTRINGNIIEFIFQTINLDTGGHGNVLLKLKTKDNLLISDMVTNKADIYFDYNFPVETNFANTTFQVLSNSIVTNDNSVGIYPNPAKDNVNIKANSAITSIEVYDAQGRIIQKKITNVENENLDVSNLTKGIYFLMIKTELGQKVEKLVKE